MARVKLTDALLDDGETPPQEVALAAPPAPAPAPVVDERPRKFTMLVGAEDDERARRVVDDVTARAGIRTTKSMRADVVRALFQLADDDPALRDRLGEALRQRTP